MPTCSQPHQGSPARSKLPQANSREGGGGLATPYIEHNKIEAMLCTLGATPRCPPVTLSCHFRLSSMRRGAPHLLSSAYNPDYHSEYRSACRSRTAPLLPLGRKARRSLSGRSCSFVKLTPMITPPDWPSHTGGNGRVLKPTEGTFVDGRSGPTTRYIATFFVARIRRSGGKIAKNEIHEIRF